MTARTRITLSCDLCGTFIDLWCTSATAARAAARWNQKWRRDKSGRDICPAHPKQRRKKIT